MLHQKYLNSNFQNIDFQNKRFLSKVYHQKRHLTANTADRPKMCQILPCLISQPENRSIKKRQTETEMKIYGCHKTGVANRGALRQIWRIACLEVAHSRFKIFRAIWVSVLSSGRKICHSNNISKKKKKSPHLVGLTFGGIFKPKVMEKVQRNRG